MKSPKLKKIVVECNNFWRDEIEIDPEIFDDVYLEAATRAIEKRKDSPNFKVTVVLETWEKKNEKKPEKHFGYNTYFVLVNAGLHQKAEMLRLNFIKMHGIDLQKESLKGTNDDGNDANNNHRESDRPTNVPKSGSAE